MNRNILVSIVIPVYNGERYIKSTIKSCLDQSYKQIEIVVIDDHSTDNSLNIIENINESRIRVYKNEHNLGLIETLNKGIKISNGMYIIPLGQDDLLSDNHVEAIIKYIDNDTSFVFCNSILIDNEGNEKGINDYHLKHKKFDTFNLSLRNTINSCGLLLNKDKFYSVGGYTIDEKFKNYGEWDLWIRLSCVGKIAFCESIKSYYRRHENNISNTFNKKQGIIKMYKYCKECMFLGYRIGKFNAFEKTVFFTYFTRYSILTIFKYIIACFNLI